MSVDAVLLEQALLGLTATFALTTKGEVVSPKDNVVVKVTKGLIRHLAIEKGLWKKPSTAEAGYIPFPVYDEEADFLRKAEATLFPR